MRDGGYLLAVGLWLVAGGAAADNWQLLERLRADRAAMVAAEQDFHQRRWGGSLQGAEAADYAAYVARLHRRVAEDCVALTAAGLPAPPELGCPAAPAPALAPAAIDQAGEQTVDELIAVLDAQLLGGLGEFDEMLLREQERVRAATPMPDAATGSEGGAGDSGTSGGAAGSEGTGGTQGAPGADGRSGPASNAGSDGGAGNGDGAGSGSQSPRGRQGAPRDIPDGSDDDVVARQLREAAEKERDPELKKRLWEEYRRYKAGTR